MKNFVLVGAIALTSIGVAACGGGGSSAAPSPQQVAQQKAAHNNVYQLRNHTELDNYNDRQKLADQASTILWCTFYPPVIGAKPFTVPIAGKLTSSNKRPWADTIVRNVNNDGDHYTPELAGPDNMFGSSSEYRYGFDPTRNIYYDFTSLPSFCTTSLTRTQFTQTDITVQTVQAVDSITAAAETAIKQGDSKKALDLLQQAESSQQTTTTGATK